MPVYIRKNVSYTPPSLDRSSVQSEDEFLQDPDLMVDSLPQPYRMIDKTLTTLFEDTWEVISTREKKRVEEANKVRPPQYDSSVQLEGPVEGTKIPNKQRFSNATCMANSADGQYVFIGLPSGLVAVEALTQQTVGLWEEDGIEMVYLKCHTLAPTVYMIVTIDDMGTGRLFAFTYNKLFMMRALNSLSQDTENKTLVSKVEASANGEYLGMVMEHGGSHDIWLEIHKLPKETWINDLDTIITAMKKKEEKDKRDEMMSEHDTESVAPSEVAPSKADTDEPSVASNPPSVAPADTGDQSQSRPNSSASQNQGSMVDGEMVEPPAPKDPLSGEYKFGSTQLIMKSKPPQPTKSGVSVSSPLTSCQKVESADVVGSGHNLLFTQNHMDLRKSVFEHLHDNLLKYRDPDEESSKLQQYPHFHFLSPGRMLPQGLEQASLEGRPTAVAVWWPGYTNLYQYSLIKTSKDTEFKADLVWPFTCKITCTEVSQDTSLFAVGLENGSLVLWDRYLGSHRGVVNVRDDSPVVQIKFLDTALFPQENNEYPPYNTGTGTFVLAMCANSALYTVSTAECMPLQINTISMPVETDNETITVLEPFKAHPDMLLTVTREGNIQIRDTLQGNIVCQFNIPSEFELASPWEPVLAIGGQGQNMYLKGNQKKSDEEGSDLGEGTLLQSGLVFVYQMRSFPSLDQYWKMQRTSKPLTVHVTAQQRADALLADRLAQQPYRKARMQERWAQMKDEINNIHQLKEVARLNASKRTVTTPGSIAPPVKSLGVK